MYHPRPLQVRLLASVVLIGCIAALMLAVWLKPDVRGVGTHQQLGLPACSLVRFAGIPCPTCGMTTAFAYTIRGRWIAGLLAQPFAFVLALGIFLCIPLSAQALISAKTWRVNWYRVSPNRTMFVIIAFFLLSWGFKIIRHLAFSG